MTQLKYDTLRCLEERITREEDHEAQSRSTRR